VSYLLPAEDAGLDEAEVAAVAVGAAEALYVVVGGEAERAVGAAAEDVVEDAAARVEANGRKTTLI
jgi:hypothetical protein